jgi:hypothetical protein
MVQLVLLACLVANPSHCESFTIPFQNEMSVGQCVWQSQIRAAEWSADHPNWMIKRMNCGLVPT